MKPEDQTASWHITSGLISDDANEHRLFETSPTYEETLAYDKKQQAIFVAHEKLSKLYGVPKIDVPCDEIRFLQALEDILDGFVGTL